MIWDHHFSSSEQAYWSIFQGQIHGQPEKEAQIMAVNDPIEIYRIARKIKTNRLWDTEKEGAMEHILKHKFNQCEEFQKELFETLD